MTVEKLMTSPVHSCSPEDNLRTPAEIMWDTDCGCVVVVGEDQRVVGVITDRDICMAAHLTGAPIGNTRVADVMSAGPCTCTTNASLEEATALMAENQVRRLPVTDASGHPVGILSLNDIALASHERPAGDLSDTVVASTLAAIGRHRPSPGSSERH